MARLPQPGGDNGNWGDILNDFLTQVHKPDGTLKNDSVTANVLAPNSITNAAIASSAITASAIADASITSAKIADGTIVAGDISGTAGITKSQLASSVQSSLDKADTALQSATSSGGTLSGFQLRKAGEKSVSVPQELANVFASSNAPAGTKIVVLAESWDKPGILKRIWMAADNTANGNGFMEQGGIIRIYTDNATIPAVSMTLGDFFYMANHSDVFATPRIGRTSRGGSGSGSSDGSAAYRYLHMPFQKYLRVEVENTTTSNTVFYGKADYTTIGSFADLGSQQLAYSIKGVRVTNQAVLTPMTVCDISGSGQVESLYISVAGAAAGDAGILEGNIEIYVDGETMPLWSSSGTEDTFNGGWYEVPVGGYPAGKAGASDQPGTNESYYRFFVDDPIFFTSHLKVVAWAGQPHEGSVVSSTVKYAGYVGVWSDTPIVPNYTAVDTVATAILDDQMSQAAGPINMSTWNQSGDRTQAAATGTSFTTPYGNANPDEDIRIARNGVSLPSDYWAETRLRITDSSHDEQQAHLVMLGANPDPYFGSAIHIQLYRHRADQWTVNVRDDFDTAFVVNIGSGRDLTNLWVRFAFKKIGATVTAYYSLNQAPSAWLPLGKWNPTKTQSAIGVGTWTAGAEFDYLVVRPIKTITS